MGVIVEWDNSEQTILRFIYQGEWTWEDFNAALEHGKELAAEVPHKIDYIYDVTTSSSVPSGALSQFRNMRNKTPTDPERRVLVGANSLITTLSQVLLSAYFPNLSKKFLVAATLEEARNMLKGAQV